jgi:MFS family permease
MAIETTTSESTASHLRRRWVQGFSSLRIYNYRLYWCGQLVSQTGTWMQNLAQAWLVLDLTRSPLALGTVSTLQFLPITIFSLFGGVIADRFPKRNLLLVTQSVATLQAVVLALLTTLHLIQIWHIYILAATLGLTTAFNGPASQSFPVELVGREEVPNAVALNSTLFNATRVAGPSLAGIAIATIGVAGCFWLNALSFLAVIGALLAMKPKLFFAVPERQRGSPLRLMQGGLKYAISTPDIFILFLMLFFLGIFGYNFGTVLPLLARFTLHANSIQYGILYSTFGAGALMGALFLAFSRASALRNVVIGAACFTAMLALVGISHIFLLSLGFLVLLGLSSIVYSAGTQTRLQILVPDELRGRVMSVYTLLFAGSTPIGSQFIGGLSERWNVSVAIEAAAAFCALGLLVAWAYSTWRRAAVSAAVAGDATGEPRRG